MNDKILFDPSLSHPRATVASNAVTVTDIFDVLREHESGTERPIGRRVALVIAGMHRSGTSALTKLAHEIGYALPITLLDPDARNNPLGHWESLPIVQFNDELLSYVGSGWAGIENISNDWHNGSACIGFTEQAVGLLEREFGNSDYFVLKDPRICRLLPFWINALKISGADPKVIHMTRAPGEVAQSLAVRNGITPALGELIWLRHVLDAEWAARHTLRVHVSYRDMIENTNDTVSRMLSALPINGAAHIPIDIQRVSGSIRTELRHQRGCQTVTTGLPGEWVETVASILTRWSAIGEDPHDHDTFDRIRFEFETMVSSYGDLLNSSLKGIFSARQMANRLVACAEAVEDVGVRAAATFIRASPLFDANWYIRRYPDVAAAGVDPASHFIQLGDGELRDPGPQFSTSRYLDAHPDVANVGMNALVHYLVYGTQEGRAIFSTV